MNVKQLSVAALVLISAFFAGRFSAPKKVEIREVVKTNEQTNTNTDRNQNSVEVIKETKLPDGTIIKETRKEKEVSVQTEKQRNTVTVRESEKSIEVRPSYRVGGVYQPAIRGLKSDAYGLILEKRLFSELYVGVLATSDKTVALTLSLGF